MTQRQTVLKMLDEARVDRRGVTNGEFVDAGIFRYGARIEELRKAGCQIFKQRLPRGGYLYTLHLDVERIASVDAGPGLPTPPSGGEEAARSRSRKSPVGPAGTGPIPRVPAGDSLDAETLFEIPAPRPHSPYEEAA